MTDKTIDTPKTSKTTLWILLAVFLVPMIASYAYYFFGKNFSYGNHGDLLNPIIEFDDITVSSAQLKPVKMTGLEHAWYMIFIADKNCEEACQKRLYEMRQMNIALGKNADRVKQMILHTSEASSTFQSFLDKEHKTVRNFTINKAKLPASMNPETSPNAIYFMDPLGNIILRFNQPLDPKLILKDMNKLLKISRIG